MVGRNYHRAPSSMPSHREATLIIPIDLTDPSMTVYLCPSHLKQAFLWWKKNQKNQGQSNQNQSQGGYQQPPQQNYQQPPQQNFQQGGGYAGAVGGGYNYGSPPAQGSYNQPQGVSHGQSPLKPHHPNYNDNAVSDTSEPKSRRTCMSLTETS